MLDLLVRKAYEGFEGELIAKRMRASLVEHLGADESLDETKDVCVGAALHLAQEPRLIIGKEFQPIDI